MQALHTLDTASLETVSGGFRHFRGYGRYPSYYPVAQAWQAYNNAAYYNMMMTAAAVGMMSR